MAGGGWKDLALEHLDVDWESWELDVRGAVAAATLAHYEAVVVRDQGPENKWANDGGDTGGLRWNQVLVFIQEFYEGSRAESFERKAKKLRQIVPLGIKKCFQTLAADFRREKTELSTGISFPTLVHKHVQVKLS